MKLINMEWLEVIKYRRTEIRFSPDIYMYCSLKMRCSELEIHMVFVYD